MEELSEAEQARAAEMKRQWIEAFGDDEFIRKCYHAGLIRGWRDVKSVRPADAETLKIVADTEAHIAYGLPRKGST
ncbi:hypothetical protein V6667_06575 [Neisseria leonii]|uniref:Uncharacterized protein n=1 Tax=Neisseria leonii TaxID=2995413 RepID=A0A9X4IE07_9NEIS|nr:MULTISPECIES: hypothetical protein [unclassified Neisseria]MDD9324764.1 hypothetical protein [Neisseria sp. 3986]MDD9327673.1 hypothetical protein [Neisseria sp. 51.81]